MHLKDWLEKNGVSQRVCGDAVGVTPGRISQIVHGDVRVPLDLAIKISNFTDGAVSLYDFGKKPPVKAKPRSRRALASAP